MGERERILAEVRERLTSANGMLLEMADMDPRNRQRLLGKAEGVRLALSYVEEMGRS